MGGRGRIEPAFGFAIRCITTLATGSWEQLTLLGEFKRNFIDAKDLISGLL